ncbi:TPA: ead/Ea22-like family protein, partial [Escherichia coli]
VSLAEDFGFNHAIERMRRQIPETPATDAFLAEVRAKAFDDLCAAFVKHASVSGLDDGDCVTVKEATDALLHCAEQLHEGVHS